VRQLNEHKLLLIDIALASYTYSHPVRICGAGALSTEWCR